MFARLMLCCLLVLGAWGSAGTALAQDVTGPRVQEALELTDRRIEQAERLVGESNNAQAASELGVAKDFQVRARTAFGSGQLAVAWRLTLEARVHAERSAALSRNLPDPERVRIQVERTADLLERSRDRLRDCDEPRARALLRASIEMQGRAEVALDGDRYLAALQLTMSARERALKAMRLCNLEDSLDESVARALARTDEVLTEANDRLGTSDNARAVQMLRSAERLQGQAQVEYRAGHNEQASRMTLASRAMAHRAMRSENARSR